jgi:transmembrane 9 superfamily member 2/4
MPLLAGLVPFAVLFIELLLIFKSLYLDKSSYYYVFGFLSIVSALLTITIAEVVLITTYIQLCAENYNWWWSSFFVGGASAFWIFVYSAWYYATRLHIEGLVSTLLYFMYSALACSTYGLATGTIGWMTAYAFVRRIYSGVKVD